MLGAETRLLYNGLRIRRWLRLIVRNWTEWNNFVKNYETKLHSSEPDVIQDTVRSIFDTIHQRGLTFVNLLALKSKHCFLLSVFCFTFYMTGYRAFNKLTSSTNVDWFLLTYWRWSPVNAFLLRIFCFCFYMTDFMLQHIDFIHQRGLIFA